MTVQRQPSQGAKPVGTKPPAPAPRPPAFTIGTERSRHFLKLLLYGIYGSGKTYLASSAFEIEKMRDVLYIDAEAGELSIPPDEMDNVIRIRNYTQMARIFEFLRLHVRMRDSGDEAGLLALENRYRPEKPVTKPHHYWTVVLDTLTEAQTYLMYQLLNVDPDNWALDLPADSPEYKEWNQSNAMIQLLVRVFRDLPMHVIFVCQEDEKEDDRKRLLKRPMLPGKLSGAVQGFMDLVGYLDTAIDGEGETRRRLWLQAGRSRFQAKHRFRGLDVKFIDNPTLEQLLKLDEESQNNARTGTAPASRPAPADGNKASTPTSAGGGTGAGSRGGSTGTVRRGPVRAAGRVRRG